MFLILDFLFKEEREMELLTEIIWYFSYSFSREKEGENADTVNTEHILLFLFLNIKFSLIKLKCCLLVNTFFLNYLFDC